MSQARPEDEDDLDAVDGEIVDEVEPEPVEPDSADMLVEEIEEARSLTPEEQVQILDLFPQVVAERDDYLDLARRVQAEFENYKRRVDAQQSDLRAQAALGLVRELLPVLDAGEAALAQGMEDVNPIHSQLVQTLEKQGLARVDADGVDFDPNVHEAVMHEPGDDGPIVAQVLRTGYLWNSKVVRPAMVKVQG